MPTYEYECKNCLHHFDAFQAMSDEPLKLCTECSGELRRVVSGGAGVIFKGSGFYNTDKKESSKKDEKGGGEKAPCGAAKEAGAACASCPAAKSA